jgi:hypothetical protein
VIGKVQSGKTNSFLALSALASDNGYRLIIILSGTKNVLRDQTYLQVVSKLTTGARAWRSVSFDPELSEGGFEQELRIALSALEERTLVITILKRTRGGQNAEEGIDRLASLLERSDLREQISRRPVLIIDDEADEASLDNSAARRRQGRQVPPSPTHVALSRLRSFFRRHLFVQYTATPQANLLVELSDHLSPDFCELLQPGVGYCGAAELFPPEETHYREIPLAELAIVAANSPVPPPSLVSALYQFYVGAALEDYQRDDEELMPPIRSMLVHPERAMSSHSAAMGWVEGICLHLFELLDRACQEPAGLHAESVRQIIGAALLDLRRSVACPDDLDMVRLTALMRERVINTYKRLINSRQQLATVIDWDSAQCWIFVGGDVLQRGFAIQGLTVSWVGRSPGQGQVDVLMQRGRFFGYRRPHLPYCRVWLPELVHEGFYALFAQHEQALWGSLERHLGLGGSLDAWSRRFWLDPNPALRICRRTSQWFRLREHPEWSSQVWFPGESDNVGIADSARNSTLVDQLLSAAPRREWRSAYSATGEASQSHEYTLVPVAQILEFLNSYSVFSSDEVDLAVARDATTLLSEEGDDELAVLVNMRPNFTGYRRGPTGRVPQLRIAQLLQGRGRFPERPNNYLGDREFRAAGAGIPDVDQELLTVQVHRPAIRLANGQVITDPGGYLSSGCPFIAIFIPDSVRHYRRESDGDRRYGS